MMSSRPALSLKMANTIGYYLAFVSLGIAVSAVGPTLQDLADKTGSSFADVSLLITVIAGGFLVSNLFLVRLYDRWPGHLIMAAVLLATGATFLVVPLMSTLVLLALVFLIVGVVEGFVDVGGNTLLVWVHGDSVGPFMNVLHFCFGVGAFVSPLIIDLVVNQGGELREVYWVLALFMLPSALWLLRLESPQADDATSNDTDQAPAIINYGLVMLIAVFFFLHVGAELTYGSLIFSYVTDGDLAGDSTGRIMTSVFWGALAIGRLVAVPVAMRFKPRVLLLADVLGWIVSIALLLAWDGLPAVYIASFGMGFSLASLFPMTIAFAERRIAITGRITGLFFVGGSIGSMTIPLMVGSLFESDDPEAISNNPVAKLFDGLLPLEGPDAMMWIILALGVLALAVLGTMLVYSPESARLDAPHEDAVSVV